MKTILKKVLIITATIIVIIAGRFAVTVHKAWCQFGIEDQLHGTFTPVADAISRFVELNGTAPKSLEALVPSYFASVPTSPHADKVEYKMIDRTSWVLNVHSRVLQPSRIYSWRTDQNLSETEKTNLLTQYHGIFVFKE